jgi:hypothetical protein
MATKKAGQQVETTERVVEVKEKLVGDPGNQTNCLQVGFGFCFGQGKFGRLFERDEEGDPVLLDVIEFVIDRRQENLGEDADDDARQAVADDLHAKVFGFILKYAEKCQAEGRDISTLVEALMETVQTATAE